MIIVLKSGASDEQVAEVERRIAGMGYRPHTIRGELRTVIGAIGDDRGKERLRTLESLETVESVTPILQPFKLASREVHQGNRIVRVGDVAIGGAKVVVMAGPCSTSPRRSRRRARVFCVAAPSSRARRPTRSRDSRRKA
jgi:3-deoxy-7-phosphoheptulonate synthase